MSRRNILSSSFGGTVLALALLMVGSLATPLSAATNYFIHRWQVEDGLPQNSVTAVVQTRDGYLWLGTYSGLARFDGVRFTVFDENNTPEMHNSRVTSLFEADDDTLWIGHENGEVTQYKNGRFQAVNYHAAWNGGKISDIGTDETGDVWLLNEEGLLARLKDGLVLTPQAGEARKLVDMTRSQDGKIWVACDGRVSLLEHGQLQVLQFDEALTNNYVQGIGASRDGGLWIAGDERVRKWKDGKWIDDLGEVPWGETPISKLIETKDGVLAAGTADHGLYFIFPGKSEKPLQFNHANGFQSDWVISLLEDREGNLWAGTGGAGLVMVRKNIIDSVAPPDQWQGRAVLTVNASRDGALWVGTEGAGLYRFQDGVWTNFGPKEGIYNPYVWSIAEDASGQLWIGTWGSGLFVQQGDHFNPAPGLEHVAIPMPAIFCDRPDKLWIGTGEGLLLYDSGQTTWFGQTNGMKNVRAVIEDGAGTVWFGMAGGGLGRLKNGTLRQFRKSDGLASDYIESLHLDDDGTLWIGTFGGGICRLKQNHFAVIGKNQGLPNNVICDIQDDGRGFFWMSSHGGIIRVSKSDLNRCADGQTNEIHCITYGLSDGLPTLECSEGRGCKTADGRLWFPTTKGLVNLDPKKITLNQLPPPVVIEEMLVDDQPVAGEISTETKPLKISPGRHRFEFQYTGLSLIAPKKVQFKYRLNGFESEWVDAGIKRVVDYNYIPPGDYSFQVIACNNDGVWNHTGAKIEFKVLPYFWQTFWFRVLASAMILAVCGGIVWFTTRQRMRRKLGRIERQRDIERERARIAHDIHDDLGAHLTRITMLSESARGEIDDSTKTAVELNQIYDTARELTRAMDEIVWAVNPKHDTLESLASYLEKFAQDLLATAGIRCRLDMPVQFPDWRLTAEVRHNLFLAFKEALHNVVKHAGATEVRIGLMLKQSSFELRVEDNGTGFIHGLAKKKSTDEPGGRFSFGNGLENMNRRLKEISGHCEVQTLPEQGTKVVFTVPLKTVPM